MRAQLDGSGKWLDLQHSVFGSFEFVPHLDFCRTGLPKKDKKSSEGKSWPDNSIQFCRSRLLVILVCSWSFVLAVGICHALQAFLAGRYRAYSFFDSNRRTTQLRFS